MFYYNIVHYAAVCLCHNIITSASLDHTTIPQGAKSQSETAVLVVLCAEPFPQVLAYRLRCNPSEIAKVYRLNEL